MRRLTTLLCALAFCAACSEPPQKELDRAQGAIDAARAAGADRYATSELGTAVDSLQQAHEAVAQRDYQLALTRALDSGERAQQAARQAADGKARARGEAERALATTAAALQQLRSSIKAADTARPAAILSAARATASSADAALQKARALVDAQEYLESKRALEGVLERIMANIQAINEGAKARGVRRKA